MACFNTFLISFLKYFDMKFAWSPGFGDAGVLPDKFDGGGMLPAKVDDGEALSANFDGGGVLICERVPRLGVSCWPRLSGPGSCVAEPRFPVFFVAEPHFPPPVFLRVWFFGVFCPVLCVFFLPVPGARVGELRRFPRPYIFIPVLGVTIGVAALFGLVVLVGVAALFGLVVVGLVVLVGLPVLFGLVELFVALFFFFAALASNLSGTFLCLSDDLLMKPISSGTTNVGGGARK